MYSLEPVQLGVNVLAGYCVPERQAPTPPPVGQLIERVRVPVVPQVELLCVKNR